MEYILSNKGGKKLIHGGYMYTKKGVTKVAIRWECTQRCALECKGLLRVDITDDTSILSSTPHSHLPSEAKVKVAAAKQEMKRKLLESSAAGGNTHQEFCGVLSKLTPEERRNFGNAASVKRSFNRYAAQGRPNNPKSIDELEIVAPWSLDEDGCRFLIFDNKNNENRILIFGTDQCLRHLSASQFWFMDGTFKVAPILFKQLYVIRAALDDSAVSAVYAFLSSKEEDTYVEMLEAISKKCDDIGHPLDPSNIMIDFEKGMFNAIYRVFGSQVFVKGCFFHLTKNTWKHIQSLGLADQYLEDEEIKLFCGMIDALAYLPLNLVADGMQYLTQNTPSGFEPLVEYFDKTYVSGTYRQIARPGQNIILRNNPPLYSPDVWNVHEATLSDGARTNNMCEAWNNAFSKLIGHHHPTVWTSIEGLKKDNMLAHLAIDQSSRGILCTKRVRQETVDLQSRLKRLAEQLDNDKRTPESYLRAVGHTIRFK